jgi:hypothetical protein
MVLLFFGISVVTKKKPKTRNRNKFKDAKMSCKQVALTDSCCMPLIRDVCGTQITAWLSGAHPTVSEGTVDRLFCFQYNTGPCQNNFNGQVRTCDDPASPGNTFYVYYLKRPNGIGCNYAFCGV